MTPEEESEMFGRFDSVTEVPFTDFCGWEFQIGDVVFFEFNWKGRCIPRRGRVTKINNNKQKIKVLSNRAGGYAELQEDTPGVPNRMFSRDFWREFWLGSGDIIYIVGDKNDFILEH